MFAHQPDHELGVLLGHAVGGTEGLGINGAQLGVVTSPALGDIVKEGCDNQQPGPFEFGDQTVAEWIFVGKVFPLETADVTDDLQNMLINRENVK